MPGISIVRKTSLAGKAGMIAALVSHFPGNTIELYQASVHGVLSDNWALLFRNPPEQRLDGCCLRALKREIKQHGPQEVPAATRTFCGC